MRQRNERLHRCFIIFILGLMATSCLPQPVPEAQPFPAGFIDKDNRLIEEVWQLATVTQHGKPINFNAIAPVTLTFHKTGYLTVLSTDCNTFGYQIIVESDKHHYRLVSGDSTAVSCDGLKQEQAIGDALQLTNRYEISEDQLLLIGEDVQVVLKPDLANYFRGDRVKLIRSHWRLIALSNHISSRPFYALEPIIVRFQNNGLIIEAGNCVTFSYMIAPRIAQSYALANRQIISTYPNNRFPNCGEPGSEQIATLVEAIEATTEYKFEGSFLRMYGGWWEIVLAPEPIPTPPPASTSPVATPTP